MKAGHPIVIAVLLLMFGWSGYWAGAGIRAESAAQSSSEPAFGGTIRVAINSDILSTNPGVLRDGNTDTVLYHIGEALVAYRDDLTVAPLLAESIALSDDRRSYTFTLRSGLTFHNGAPVTAREVKWTWERLLDPETGFRCREFYNGQGANGLKIQSVDILDDLRVRFTLNKPSALFLDRMANLQCQTPILHPASVGPDGEWRQPVGTGPYKLGEWKKGQSVTLDRFDGYVSQTGPRNGLTGEKIAYADHIVFVVTPDRIAAKSSVYAGNIDLLFAMPLSAYNEVQRRREHRGDIRIYEHDTLDWTVLLLQTRAPLLSDVRMRRAIAHAVSGEMVATFSTFGLGNANPSATQTLSRFHKPLHDQWYDFDPEKARALAREAGYDGQVLTIQTNRKFTYMFNNVVAIQAMLNAAGFNAKIEVYDWATQLTNFFAGDFQLSSFGYSARSHPALLYGNFTGSKDLRQSYQWDDPKALDLIRTLETAFTDDQMQQALDQLHLEMKRQVPMIGIYNDHVVDISRAVIHGYEPWAFGRPRMWGVWTTERKQ
jgi:peptide/nickel transport system substrate-binding protein